MPIAMEHALERVADKRGLKGEERDAFIYGTMRKTGWKPKREHKMPAVDISPKVTPFMNTEHLIKLSERLDAINFEDDDKKRHLIRDTAGAAALGGAVYGGISAHDKIRNAGGYGKAIRDTKEVFRGGMTGNPAPNLNLGGKAISYSGHAAMAGKKAGMSVIDWIKKLGKGAIGAINANDSSKLVEMSHKLDELIEFGTLKKVLAGSAIAGAGATAGIGAMHMATVMHNQKKWAKDAKDKELLKVTNDLYVDKHGAMYDSKHPHVKNCKITELSVK